MAKQKPSNSGRPVVQNRRARYDYEILETVEAGIALTGTEVKSLRAGRAQLRDSYGRIRDGEVWLHGMHISPYEAGNRYNPEPRRPRKLLLHREEIERLRRRVEERGLTLVPLRVFFNARGWAKVELAVAKGRARYDKRRAIGERDQQRDVERQMREFQKQ